MHAGKLIVLRAASWSSRATSIAARSPWGVLQMVTSTRPACQRVGRERLGKGFAAEQEEQKAPSQCLCNTGRTILCTARNAGVAASFLSDLLSTRSTEISSHESALNTYCQWRRRLNSLARARSPWRQRTHVDAGRLQRCCALQLTARSRASEHEADAPHLPVLIGGLERKSRSLDHENRRSPGAIGRRNAYLPV